MEQLPLPAFDSTSTDRTSKTLQLAIFGTCAAWFVSAEILAGRAARGLTNRFDFDAWRQLLSSIFLLFLLAIGFSLLNTISHHYGSLRSVLGLPKRPTAREEWVIGAAIGWGIVVLAVLPMGLAGTLYVHLWTAPRAFGLLLLNLATFLVAALAEEIAFRGYPFRSLIEAVGPTGATVIMAMLFGMVHMLNNDATWTSVLITMLAGVLLSVGWLRTHGLWLPWGLHFAWNASMGIIFGLPVSGITDFSSVVRTQARGPLWLTGGYYGPEAALFTMVAITVGIIFLVRLTRDYAWHYTYTPATAGGYPMDAPPPAAHTAMEQQARPAALIQILPTTPQNRSATDDPKP
jgi:membrane protease YdiL (CAAX protease family)